MDEHLSEADFLNLTDDEVVAIVQKIGRPKVVVLMPDATRRTGIIYKRMKPDSADFENILFDYLSEPFTNLAKIMYNQGLKTLFIPGFTHGNLQRGKRYVKALINTGVKSILNDDYWLDFYRDFQVNVNFYGDFQFIKNMVEADDFTNLIMWCEEVKKLTRHNRKRTFYWGFACSSTLEYERLAKISIDFYKEFNEYPDRKKLIKLYYGKSIDNVDIYIRPGEVRDSDCQPPIIGGLSQLYFPVVPLTELDPDFYRRILFDYLYNRIITYSKKSYFDSDFYDNKLDQLSEFYNNNKNEIIGLGNRIGKFWVPKLNEQ
jgi:hypothetical protein